MTNSNTRAEFEAWALRERMSIERFVPTIHKVEKGWEEYANRDYFTFFTEDQWRCWQAARRSALLEAAMVRSSLEEFVAVSHKLPIGPERDRMYDRARRALADEGRKP